MNNTDMYNFWFRGVLDNQKVTGITFSFTSKEEYDNFMKINMHIIPQLQEK